MHEGRLSALLQPMTQQLDELKNYVDQQQKGSKALFIMENDLQTARDLSLRMQKLRADLEKLQIEQEMLLLSKKMTSIEQEKRSKLNSTECSIYNKKDCAPNLSTF